MLKQLIHVILLTERDYKNCLKNDKRELMRDIFVFIADKNMKKIFGVCIVIVSVDYKYTAFELTINV